MLYRAGGGGWMYCRTDELEVRVRFRLAEDQRLVPWQVFVEPRTWQVGADGTYERARGGQELSEARLADVPLNEIEAAANGPQYRPVLVERIGEDAGPTWRGDDGEPVTERRRRRPTGKLPLPKGSKYPDSFYRRVAEEYARLVADGVRSPGATMAEANDVPASTAHRWIKEARRRGFLAAGRAGRAG